MKPATASIHAPLPRRRAFRRALRLGAPLLLLALLPGLAVFPAPPARSADSRADALSQRTYRIRYHKFDEVLGAVNERLSERGEVSYRRALREIVVRDLEEVLRSIDEIVREMDVPPRKVELQVTLFEASRAGEANDPRDLAAGTAGRLRNLMKYTHFDVIGSSLVTGLEGESSTLVIERPGPRGTTGYKVQVRIEYVDEGRELIGLNRFELLRETSRDAAGRPAYASLLSTSLNPRAGQPLLVGAARSENAPRAIFCAIRVRILE